MNRQLPCGCQWQAGRGYVCPAADALQRGIEAAQATGNILLVQHAEQALVGHWRENGLTRREFDAVAARSDALLRRDASQEGA